ncbi:hypothetical protein QTP88_020651 [Uroleucon formosanum]
MQDTNKQFKIFLLYSDEECINILINTNNTNILSSINWESEFKNLGIEAAASRLQTILITLIEQYVPVHIFRRSTFPKWATLKLKNLIIDKKIAHKKLKQFGTMHYRHRFSLLRAQVKLESRLAYESYLSKINTSLQKDPRQFWSFINNRRNTSGIPNVMHYGDIITSDVDIANLFALLFNSVYKSPLPPIHWNSENIGIKLFTFLPSRLTIDPDEVEENLSSLRTTKSRGHDGISAQLLYLLFCVQSESDAISLQESLNKLVHWCNTVGLELTIHKCKVMSFSRRHSIIQYDYSIDNVILQRINQVEDLEIVPKCSLMHIKSDFLVTIALEKNFLNSIDVKT